MTRRTQYSTKAPGQPNFVISGSPLAVIGIFVSILRERFTAGNGPSKYPWEEDPNKTKIIIESGFEDNNTVRGKKPGIFVDKDESSYGKLIIGDRTGLQLQDMKDFQWTLCSVPIIIDCVASRKGESAVIGDIVQWTLHAASDVIQGVFGLHDMTPPTLGRTTPFELDKEAWSTPVSFQVQFNVRWILVPIAPLLQQIATRITASGMSADDYFLDIVQHNSSVDDD